MRIWGVRALSVLFALGWLGPGFGLVDLSATWDPGWSQVLEAGWGLLFTVHVGGGLLAVAVGPRRPAAGLVELTLVAAVLVLSAAAAGEGPAIMLAGILAVQVVVLVRLLRGAPGVAPVVPVHLAPWPAMAVLAVLGALPWCVYAVSMYRANRAGMCSALDEITLDVDHCAVQGGLAVTLAALSVLAACWPAGRLLLGSSVALSATYLGLVSAAWPGTPGAYGRTWSVLSIAWSAALIALALRGKRSAVLLSSG